MHGVQQLVTYRYVKNSSMQVSNSLSKQSVDLSNIVSDCMSDALIEAKRVSLIY